MPKKDIKNLTLAELKKIVKEWNEPQYRAEQIFFWLYQKGSLDFAQMVNLPSQLREKLNTTFYISSLTLARQFKSEGRAEKFLFQTPDGNFIESVLIYAKGRKTICLSSQVGCKFACFFCASGRRGLVRNLTTAEIVNQIVYLQQQLKHKITNFVFMGMGEPLDNYENVARAIRLMNEPKALRVGARRITVSTCGIIKGIEELQKLGLQINLSVSLHAPNNQLRDELMPINRRYPLEKLIASCQRYSANAARTITLEYILIKDKNDSCAQADELAKIARRLRAKVNLIPYSPIVGLNLQPPAEKDIRAFMNRLKGQKVSVTVRESKGKNIQAACGQLAGINGRREENFSRQTCRFPPRHYPGQ